MFLRLSDRWFFGGLAALTVAVIVLAALWPQGLGDRSPAPFGHPPVQRSAAMQAAMKRETEAAQGSLNQARDAVRDLQSQAIAPSQ